MKAILIDAYKKTVTEVEYDGTLQAIYALLKCSTIEAVRISETDSIYVDEEGAVNGTEVGFSFSGNDLFGSGLVVSHDDEGNDQPPKSTVDEVTNRLHSFFEPFVSEN